MIVNSAIAIFLAFLGAVLCTGGANENEPVPIKQIVVAQWEFHEFSTHVTVMVFLLIVILIKMLFRRIPYLREYLPESLVLIICGVIFAAIIRYGIQAGSLSESQWKLTPTLFFQFLLPPIILESAYSLYNRTFSEHLGVILIFAVLGTILNFLIIGFAMFGLYTAGAFGPTDVKVDIKGMLLFSSLIVAIDPVAVLAIFQDIGVELSLYYIVFGESLLNDAITVVLYDIMSAFSEKDQVSGHEIGVGIASFFTVSLGGLLIGVVIGVISCLITRLKSRLNAFTLLLLAYFSYIMGDMVGWSGIISMIGCGLVQIAYAFHNLDETSVHVVHNLTKLVAEVSESVIFLFLGAEMLLGKLEWDTGFILWGLVMCLIARTLVVLILSAIINAVRGGLTGLTLRNQLILIYGGLRGAVAFSLAVLIAPQQTDFLGHYNRRVIITATLFIILFTVGIMGTTMKPLVKLLKITMQSKGTLSVLATLNDSIIDETNVGIEMIVGSKGRNVIREFFMRLDEKYLRKVLQRDPMTYDQKLMIVYEKMALKLHEAAMHPERANSILSDVPAALRTGDMVTTDKQMSDIFTIEEGEVYDADDDEEFAAPSGEVSAPEEVDFNVRSSRRAMLSTGGRQGRSTKVFKNAVRHRIEAYRRMSQLNELSNAQIR